ncbi:hypothetical protein [Streptomyces sp. NPDC048191]|uniref:hypothetical protein n=1 Tax=Streptomyces sp. NPDC048191 TaxID=3155484 RepID=UPI003403BD85
MPATAAQSFFAATSAVSVAPFRRRVRRVASAVALAALLAVGAAVVGIPAAGATAVAAGSDSLIWG